MGFGGETDENKSTILEHAECSRRSNIVQYFGTTHFYPNCLTYESYAGETPLHVDMKLWHK